MSLYRRIKDLTLKGLGSREIISIIKQERPEEDFNRLSRNVYSVVCLAKRQKRTGLFKAL